MVRNFLLSFQIITIFQNPKAWLRAFKEMYKANLADDLFSLLGSRLIFSCLQSPQSGGKERISGMMQE